jgi:hypothetical protein
MATEDSPIIGPDWDGYSYPYGDGLLARINFDTRTARESPHIGYPECVRVILFIPPDRLRPDGQPVSVEEMESLLAENHRLVDHLSTNSVHCRFVGSMLYGGMFDLVFQVESQECERFKTTVSEWTGTAPAYRVEVKQSSGWDFFDAKVRPSPAHAQQIADRQAIQALIDAGSDPTRPHQLDHRIEGPPEVLRQIASDLEAKEFVNARFPSENVLLINTESPLDLLEIWDTTGRLVEYCANRGARYVGWGAAVVHSGGRLHHEPTKGEIP